MSTEDKEKAGFICSGFYQFEHMFQGNTGTLVMFQRLRERAVGDVNRFLLYLGELLQSTKTGCSRFLIVLEVGLNLSIDKNV